MLVALVSDDTANGGSFVGLFVLIGLVVVIMVGVLIYRIRSSKSSATTGQAAQMAALRRHHTPLWSSGNQRSFRPEPVHWGLAVAAPFSLCSDEPWDRVRDDDMEGVRRELAASWRIQGRLTMLRAMYNLLTTGSREEYVREIARWLAMDVKEAASFERMLRSHARKNADSARMLWQFRRVRTNARDITQANFLAWDFVRAAMLARAGATAGYLSEAEAEDFFYMIADELRQQYSSWEELGESFLLAHWFRSAPIGNAEREFDLHDRSRQEALLGGPWRVVPWNLRTPAPRMLFADALAEDPAVFHLERESYAADGAVWATRLKAEVRARTDGAP